VTGHSTSAAGVSPPDTKLAAEATELVRESTTHFVPGFERRDFVETIENSPWPE
jgi:hypothetical protein